LVARAGDILERLASLEAAIIAAHDGRRAAGPIAAGPPVIEVQPGVFGRLAEALEALLEVLRRRPDPDGAERLVYRADELAQALGISRRELDRARAMGRIPKPTKVLGRMPVWSVSAINKWLSDAK
jgi:predicted DNA-binding transcriptional regulator AlpA